MTLIAIIIVAAWLLPPCLQQTNSLAEAFSPSPLVTGCHHHHHHHHHHHQSLHHPHVVRLAAANTNKNGNDKDTTTTSSSTAATRKKQNQPWDVFRFISQSSKFIRPPSLPQLIIGATAAGKKKRRIAGSGMLFCCLFYCNRRLARNETSFL